MAWSKNIYIYIYIREKDQSGALQQRWRQQWFFLQAVSFILIVVRDSSREGIKDHLWNAQCGKPGLNNASHCYNVCQSLAVVTSCRCDRYCKLHLSKVAEKNPWISVVFVSDSLQLCRGSFPFQENSFSIAVREAALLAAWVCLHWLTTYHRLNEPCKVPGLTLKGPRTC